MFSYCKKFNYIIKHNLVSSTSLETLDDPHFTGPITDWDPHFILISLADNDVYHIVKKNRSLSPSNIADLLVTKILSKVTHIFSISGSSLKKVLILELLPRDLIKSRNSKYFTDLYNDIAFEVNRRLKQKQIEIEMGSQFHVVDTQFWGSGIIEHYFDDDGVHLSPEGDAKMARCLKRLPKLMERFFHF